MAGQHDFPPENASAVRRQVEALQDEVMALRRRLAEAPARARVLEERLAALQAEAQQLATRNERLSRTLTDAREQIVTLKSEVDRLA